MKIGAQLYTLREYCKTLDGFAETLKRVADIGYTTVQVSGTCKYAPEWLDGQLKANSLTCALTHYDSKRIADDTQSVIAEHNVFGCKYIGIGSMPGGVNGNSLENFVRNYKDASEKIKNADKLFCYHNHGKEFKKHEGKLYIERLAEEFADDEMGFTLDTYWINYAGYDACEWIERLKGRVPCLHLKDMAKKLFFRKMAPVGKGNMDFDRILSSAQKADSEYLLVEQDYCYGKNPFECLRTSYEWLKSRGLQ